MKVLRASALDAESETLVGEGLERGRIVEEGRHDQLMAAGGTYAGLVARQTRGFFPLAA